MDYVLQAIERQWPGQGRVLSQAVQRIGVAPSRRTAHAPCRLTRSGSPVEFAFCWDDGLPRLTADPAPGATPAVRVERALALSGDMRDARLSGALRTVLAWQRAGQADYGAWVGARERGGQPGFKLYAEVPADAPWSDWEQRQVGASPVLPSRGVRLCMLGLDPSCGALELYYRLDALYPREIDTLLRRAGLPPRSCEITELLETLENRAIRREIPCADLGFSYAFLPDGTRAFTLYAFAHSLLGGDGAIRRSILSLIERRGWDGSAYRAISAPLADRHNPMTFHGMVGCLVAAEGPLRFTAGIAPHPPAPVDAVAPAGGSAAPLLREVLAEQGCNGGFRSQVEDVTDENCCVTALVLLELADCPAEAARRALDFLEQCEDPRQPGAFRFYPWSGDSPRLPIMRLDADADDTALALLALIKHGRRGADDARRALADVIEPHRAHFLRGDEPPWVCTGAMRTWLIPRAAGNPVDCCVNANVAALYAAAGRTADAGFRAACDTVAAAVRATSAAPAYLRTVAPYYLHPLELLYAVRRAVAFGASPLAGTLEALEAQPWAGDDRSSGWFRRRPLCANAGGRPVWVAPPLQAARQLSSWPQQLTTA